ncbi:tryptophan 7-halogenase [Paraglaciecola aquimarina]|uniref:Tryptophan 7-halogenase n=1 Tax=Paraglaciecola algarum TaxID=3050085 RepID=A0ABS9DAF3_9ALTE|nr:tryptophan halogenase family protein [Paraglaciecola sp. G1-23]MCF2949925.1 tryptophan 7-halogenase [Paraglaciecola sp. G1-23]
MNADLSSTHKHIVILGGGTAGWMSASLMMAKWKDKAVNITLVESPAIGIIGVGEGSTPQLKTFFEQIGIEESEWMPACNATYKNGITFKGWSSRPGFNSYFHPFASRIDAFSAPAFFYNSMFRRKGISVDSHPDRFYLSAYLAKHHKSPIPNENFPFPIGYGYHFDSGLLGQFLAKKSVQAGVNHIQAKVLDVGKHANGDLAFLQLDNGQQLSADFFVDCSGFNGELIQKHLAVPFHSYKDNLFNDNAVTIASSTGESINSQTISTTLKHGWAWDIPLTNRTGNGYVYSSDYTNANDAELELRQKLNLVDSDVEARHLKMKVGRVEKHWYRNCLAVGLSQGFIEPLEATALHFVQETIEGFIQAFEPASFSTKPQDTFNLNLNNRFEGIRDYIVAHYRLSSRDDTDYWRANSENPNISNTLKKIVNAWMAGEDLNQTFAANGKNSLPSYYPPFSWQCLLAGYGVFPEKLTQVGQTDPAHKYDLEYIDDFIQKCGLNFKDHKHYLENHL